MTKNLKTIKASIILGIVIVGLIASVAPSSSAGVFTLTPVVSINIDNQDATKGIVPADPNGKTIEVTVYYSINGYFAEQAAKDLGGKGKAHISASIGDVPSYCNVNLLTQDLFIPVSNKQEGSEYPIKITVTFLENAPLLAVVNIPLILKAEVPRGLLWKVEDITVTKTIPVTAAYVPIIDAVPQETFKEVAPGDIAEFKIDLENKGNAETQFVFDLSQVPEGWTASIISQTKISSAALGGNDKKTVSLQIRPPYQFGWHDEQKQITVTVKGYYYADTASGQNITSSRPIDIRILVRNRGFSFQPGWEMLLIVIIIVVLLLVLLAKKYNYIMKK